MGEVQGFAIVHCPVCDSSLKIPVRLLGKEGVCATCGTHFTPPAPATPPLAPGISGAKTGAREGNGRRRWAVFLGLACAPVLVLAALSVWVGAAGSAFALRVYIMNMLMVLLFSYCLIAGLYDPEVLGRLFRLSLSRAQIAAVFLPLLLVELLCALTTYSP